MSSLLLRDGMFIVEKYLIIPYTIQIYTIIINQQGFLDFYVLYKLCIFVSKQYNTAFLKLIQYNMGTFGKRLRECRESKGFSQQDLAKRMNTRSEEHTSETPVTSASRMPSSA